MYALQNWGGIGLTPRGAVVVVVVVVIGSVVVVVVVVDKVLEVVETVKLCVGTTSGRDGCSVFDG